MVQRRQVLDLAPAQADLALAPAVDRQAPLRAVLVDREQLLETIRAARRRQAADLKEAAERGLDLVPKLLRAPVKKAILG